MLIRFVLVMVFVVLCVAVVSHHGPLLDRLFEYASRLDGVVELVQVFGFVLVVMVGSFFGLAWLFGGWRR